MKKLTCAALAVLILVVGNPLASQARERGHESPAQELRQREAHRHELVAHHRVLHPWVWSGIGGWGYAAPSYVYAPPAPVYAQPDPQTYWYYCDYWQTYYPYVTDCPSGWRAVTP